MPAAELCRLCESRKPKRHCIGINGEICSPCCGQEREQTIDCPLECEYLIEARRFEKTQPIREEDLPNSDVPLTEEFLNRNDPMFGVMGKSLVRAALETGAIDRDIVECLETAIKTFRTLESGLYYESKPASAYAGAIQQRLLHDVAEFRRLQQQETGISSTRDLDVLGLLVFLQRISLHLNNGRARGRSFVDFLRGRFPIEEQTAPVTPQGSLIL